MNYLQNVQRTLFVWNFYSHNLEKTFQPSLVQDEDMKCNPEMDKSAVRAGTSCMTVSPISGLRFMFSPCTLPFHRTFSPAQGMNDGFISCFRMKDLVWPNFLSAHWFFSSSPNFWDDWIRMDPLRVFPYQDSWAKLLQVHLSCLYSVC